MIDEWSSLNQFAMDECPMREAIAVAVVVAVVAGTVEVSDDCVEPFEAVDAYFHLILSAEASSDYQRN